MAFNSTLWGNVKFTINNAYAASSCRLDFINEFNLWFNGVFGEQKSLPTPEDVKEIIKFPIPRLKSDLTKLFYPDLEDYNCVPELKWPYRYGVTAKDFIYNEESEELEVHWPRLKKPVLLEQSIEIWYRRPNFLARFSNDQYK